MFVIPQQSAMQTLVARWIVIVPIIAGCIRVFPIECMRIIKTEAKTVFSGSTGKLAHRVSLERGRITNVVAAHRRRIHGEPVMMLGGDDDVSHTRRLNQPDPL